MAGTQTGLLCFVLMASWINRTFMSPVAEQHIAAFDEIARVNERYGNTFLLSSSLDKCPFHVGLPLRTWTFLYYSPFVRARRVSFFRTALRITSVCARFAQAVFDFPIISESHLSFICYR